jgi:hypothetical protein
MLRQLLIGGLVCLCNISIHALVMTVVIAAARRAHAARTDHPAVRLIGVMIAAVSVLMMAHACEVAIWAFAYRVVDIAPQGANLVYFAFVNYTTLGYGDITPDRDWLLLGPIAAMNGILMFGWSTAMIFEILRKAMEK